MAALASTRLGMCQTLKQTAEKNPSHFILARAFLRFLVLRFPTSHRRPRLFLCRDRAINRRGRQMTNATDIVVLRVLG